ncbi:hypothetical protein [Subtercola lobariae]|uniref:HEPN domain-containing protein n=1 Tax=Subtercola lobariae TaxID=1588641 RepID=A0A917EY79_9MICO|nr:hypothetical protein [Subtercola lobariae]GGF21542.1 hypothetical protein GCM10011399_14070 [Subtercola lobariae]
MSRQALMTRADAKERATTAREFLRVAEDQLALIDGAAGLSAGAQVAASNAIMAGIATADAICGKELGVRANDADHRAAAAQLATVEPDGVALSKRLMRLVKDKSLLHYGGYCTSTKAAEMTRQAYELVVALASTHGL